MVIAGVLLIVLSCASFVALILALVSVRDSAELARHTTTELAQAAEVETLILDMETGLRGFTITRDGSFLEPWNTARRAFPQKARALARFSDRSAARALIRKIEVDGRSYIESYGIPLIQAVRRNDPSARGPATGGLAFSVQGKIRVDELRSQFDRFAAVERATLDARRDAADADFTRAIVFASTSVALVFALVALFGAYLARIVVRPVSRAAAMAQRLASGDLKARMPETGVAEVGALERSFNTMVDSLDTSQSAQKRLLDQQSALRRVAGLVAEERPPEEVFTAVTREVGELLPADVTLLGRYEPDGTVSALAVWARSGRTAGLGGHLSGEHELFERVRVSGEVARQEGDAELGDALAEELRFGIGCPIIVERRVWGIISAAATKETSLSTDAEPWTTDFAGLVATAIANATARAELSESRARIVAASDETRRRLERDLHDGAQQRLVAIMLELRAVASGEPVDDAELRSKMVEVVEELDGVTNDLREISRGIHPAVLSEGGLRPALRTLAGRSAVPVELDVETQQRFPDRIEVAAYYVVSEALTNAAKHARATRVNVAVEATDGVLRVAVRDDGAGGADPARGSGLVGLHDRVDALGGRIDIVSPRGGGTTLVIELPL
jgi:signal transduction histidine kinase